MKKIGISLLLSFVVTAVNATELKVYALDSGSTLEFSNLPYVNVSDSYDINFRVSSRFKKFFKKHIAKNTYDGGATNYDPSEVRFCYQIKTYNPGIDNSDIQEFGIANALERVIERASDWDMDKVKWFRKKDYVSYPMIGQFVDFFIFRQGTHYIAFMDCGEATGLR